MLLRIALGLSLVDVVIACVAIPVPAQTEPDPMQEFERIVVGETTRDDVTELMDEPVVVSRDGTLAVHGASRRTGGGWMVGTLGAGGGFRNQDLHVAFVRYGDDNDIVLEAERVVVGGSGFEPICITDGPCVGGAFQVDQSGLLGEVKASGQSAYLMTDPVTSEAALSTDPGDDCLIYGMQRKQRYLQTHVSYTVRLIDDAMAESWTVGPRGFVVWRAAPGAHLLRTEPAFTSALVGYRRGPAGDRAVFCRPGQRHYVEVEVKLRSKMWPFGEEGPSQWLEFHVREMTEEEGRAALEGRRLIVSE